MISHRFGLLVFDSVYDQNGEWNIEIKKLHFEDHRKLIDNEVIYLRLAVLYTVTHTLVYMMCKSNYLECHLMLQEVILVDYSDNRK